MYDFTLHTLRLVLSTLKEHQYSFLTFAKFIKNPSPKSVVARHDVDARKMNSLNCARMEKEMEITGTYYFRMGPKIFNEDVIEEISGLGHEIGYHYEDLAVACGNYDLAIKLFERNLAKLRRVAPVETICMHGSPFSKHDNRMLWEKYKYRDYGIIGEPYLDIDFNEMLYLTDTGRRWDGDSVNIRDKATLASSRATGKEKVMNGEQPVTFPKFHSTYDIINAANNGTLHKKIMLTFHPQRWDNRPIPWLKELVWQNIKNSGKRVMAVYR